MDKISFKALTQELKCWILPIGGKKLVLMARLILGITEKKPKHTVDQLEDIKNCKEEESGT